MAELARKSLILLITIYTCIGVVLVSAQSENFVYNNFRGKESDFYLDGIAKLLPGGQLRLTDTSQQQLGHAFWKLQIGFKSSLSFSTTFVFAITGDPSNTINQTGHGFAFIISPSVYLDHPDNGDYLGIINHTKNGYSTNHIVAIEFDINKSTGLDDINNNHVGIDVNSLVSNISAPASYFSNEGQNIPVQLVGPDQKQVWIDYDEENKLLNVTLAPLTIPKPNQPLLTKSIDLSQVFLDTMYVGFSASSAAVTANHYILGWSFSRSIQNSSLDPSKLPPVPKTPEKLSRTVIFVIVFAVVVVVITSAAAYLYWRIKFGEVLEEWERQYMTQRFSYRTLYKATKGFQDTEIIGRGGFGNVYKGKLPSSNKQVAVKKLSHDAKQGMQQFVSEVASMARLRHKNLVQPLGYCRRKGELLLVYDYMPNGSLDSFLFFDNKPKLSWPQRLHIIKDVAAGLFYLHDVCDQKQVVLHRDIKSSNVLIDADLNGKLGDFGLARFHDRDNTNLQATRVVGTIGYMALELSTTGIATTSTDVFAFGAFMLEVACERRPVDPQRSPKEIILVRWVFECLKKGVLLKTIDSLMEGYVEDEVELVLRLSLLCQHHDPEARPTVKQVIDILDGNASFPETPLDAVGIGIQITGNEGSATFEDIPLSANHIFDTNSALYTGR